MTCEKNRWIRNNSFVCLTAGSQVYMGVRVCALVRLRVRVCVCVSHCVVMPKDILFRRDETMINSRNSKSIADCKNI